MKNVVCPCFLVAHQHAVVQGCAALGWYCNAPLGGPGPDLRVAARFLEHGPVARHRLAKPHPRPLLFRISQPDLISALESGAPLFSLLPPAGIWVLFVWGCGQTPR